MRRGLHDPRHFLQREVNAGLMRNGGQMQPSIGRTTGGANDNGSVFQRFAGDDIARANAQTQQIHHRPARLQGPDIPLLIRRRRTGGIGQRQANHLGNAGHGIGGELAATGASARAGMLLKFEQLLIAHHAGGMLAHRLEHIHHRHIAAMMMARHDRAAIHEDAGHIQPHHGHHHARQRFVASRQPHHRVIAMAAHGQFNRIGNHITADEAGLHALMAHGNAIRHRDGGEFARAGAGLAHALLGRLRLAGEGDIAGCGLIPAGGNTHQRRGDLLRRHAHGVIIAAMGRALRADGDVPARHFGFVPGGHGAFSPCGRLHRLVARGGRLGKMPPRPALLCGL